MTDGDGDMRRTGEELLLLAAYLLSSGRGLLTEPASYGSMRCLDAARRTLTLAAGLGATDAELAEVRTELENFMGGAMGDRDLETFLDDLCGRLADTLNSGELIAHE